MIGFFIGLAFLAWMFAAGIGMCLRPAADTPSAAPQPAAGAPILMS